jgi:hypothetical protein
MHNSLPGACVQRGSGDRALADDLDEIGDRERGRERDRQPVAAAAVQVDHRQSEEDHCREAGREPDDCVG